MTMELSHFYFSGREIPETLQNGLKLLAKQGGKKKILDLGCGDGALMRDLVEKYSLEKDFSLVGVDISEKSCSVAKKRLPRAEIVQADAVNLPFNPNSFNLVYSWVVIKHIVDQEKMILETYRVLKKRGIFIVGTVLRKKYAFYVRRKKGHFVLDPTHVREYGSPEELTRILENAGFVIKKIKITRHCYPLLELILRGLVKLRVLSPTLYLRDIFLTSKFTAWLKRLICVPIPGYFRLEVLAVKG